MPFVNGEFLFGFIEGGARPPDWEIMLSSKKSHLNYFDEFGNMQST